MPTDNTTVTLREFLTINRDGILFIYGQVFFVMGLAIALQSRRNSRLELSRSLRWLALFGIVHGLYEWGDLFIPLQAQYLSAPWVRALNLVHLIAIGASFACLFQFGMSLLRSMLQPPLVAALRWVPLLVLLGWMAIIVFIVLPLSPDFGDWLRVSNALARYAIGLPGSLLAAYALRRYAHERITPLGMPHILRSERLSGILLMLYGIFGGLIAPPTPFFPSNWLNTISFYELTGVPVLLFRSLIGLGLAITVIRTLEVFDVETERIIESMEQQQILNTERERIGRDLHDGAIQMVYTAGLLVESALKLTPEESALRSRLSKAVVVIQDAIVTLRRNLVELHHPPQIASLSEGLQHIADDPRFTAFVQITVNCEDIEYRSMSSARVEHILAVTNEALSNVVRHASARHVRIQASCDESRLRLMIQDDGCGLPSDLRSGYGLRNMRDRARLLGGTLDVADAAKHGTQVSLDIPRSDER